MTSKHQQLIDRLQLDHPLEPRDQVLDHIEDLNWESMNDVEELWRLDLQDDACLQQQRQFRWRLLQANSQFQSSVDYWRRYDPEFGARLRELWGSSPIHLHKK
jgi:hypothetical protein